MIKDTESETAVVHLVLDASTPSGSADQSLSTETQSFTSTPDAANMLTVHQCAEVPAGMKRCTKCGEVKGLEGFYANRTSKGGRRSYCVACQSAYSKAYIQIPHKRELCRRSLQARRERCPEKVLWQGARARSRKSGIPFNIEVSDIVIPATCSVLNIPIYRNRGSFGPNSPSLDRINPALGYIKGNIRVISHRANMLKSNATPLEILQIALDLERIRMMIEERRTETYGSTHPNPATQTNNENP